MVKERGSNVVSFVSPSLTAGGAERVITELANYAVAQGLNVNLVVLTRQPHHFELDERIQVFEPDFDLGSRSRLAYQWRNFWWLRSVLKQLDAGSILSFGGKYNSFVLLAARGINNSVFISDRSKPTISYGYVLDLLNPFIYRQARGIVCQTSSSKEVQWQRTKHSNIAIIPNPIRLICTQVESKENRILNVGRFIQTKHQDYLVEYFGDIETGDWQLDFVGDGPQLEAVKAIHTNQAKADSIHFFGNTKSIEDFYKRSAIFAFTSSSEGFPNALAEAMQAGCACLSFDCEAGPSDLIEDGVNGYLIPLGNHRLYQEKLQLLIDDPTLRKQLGDAAHKSMEALRVEKVGAAYLDFMINS